jgi:hypothetical protein
LDLSQLATFAGYNSSEAQNAAAVNGLPVYVAEVDANKKLVKMVSFKISGILDYGSVVQGSLTGTVAFATDQDVENLNPTSSDTKTFTVSIDGGAAVPVTITFSDYTPASITTKIEGALSAAGESALFGYDANNHIVITSASSGFGSTVEVGGTDAALIFGAHPTIVNGSSVG